MESPTLLPRVMAILDFQSKIQDDRHCLIRYFIFYLDLAFIIKVGDTVFSETLVLIAGLSMVSNIIRATKDEHCFTWIHSIIILIPDLQKNKKIKKKYNINNKQKALLVLMP